MAHAKDSTLCYCLAIECLAIKPRWGRGPNGTGPVFAMGNSGHILIVDDEPKVRTLLRRCLEGEGFAVSEAKDGAEMRLRLEREAVSLITLDLNLGRENGL